MAITKHLPGRIFILSVLFLATISVQAKPPNIVFILTDDLDEEVFRHQQKIKKLITDKGMDFKNNFVSLSLCCPSRAAILRGQYAHNTGIFDNALPNGGFRKFFLDGLENSTVATWLNNAGYQTALFGKYLNSYPSIESGTNYIPPGWSHWVSTNGGKPYTEYNYSLNDNGTTVSYADQPADHMVDVLSNKAAKFIKDTVANAPQKPFFIYVAPYLPHNTATPPPRYLNDFPGIKAPRPASFNEADVSDKPAWVQAKSLLPDTHIAAIDDLYRKRRQSMEAVGDMVENLLNTLKEVGELNNTYIFFTSDNGFHQGQHRLDSGKDTAFEEDIKVPLVVRGPGVPAGITVTQMTANVDFAPTWAEIAGITPPDFVDGRSLLPFLKGANPVVWRKTLLLEHRPSITPSTANGLLEPQDPYDIQLIATKGPSNFVGLRTEKYAIGTNGPMSYVEYDTGEREFYSLWKDPLQLNNAYVKTGLTMKKRLSKWLGALRHASRQALRDAEQTVP